MMKTNYSKNQRGVVTVLVVMALPVLLLIMGLALDFGHVFVNKTRLQNALDATALSAAIAINGDIGKDSAKESRATAAGRATFNCFIGNETTGCVTPGNGELKGLDEGTLVFEYSKTLNPWGTFDPATDAFAFVKVTSTNMLNVTPVLIRIMDDMPIPARATAGPVGSNCCVMPFTLCASTASGPPLYGYAIDQIYDLNHDVQCTGSGKDQICADFSAGNYGLLNLPGSQGGNDIKLALEGKQCTNTCPLNGNLPLNTQTGNVWGPVSQGIEYRINTLDTNHNNYTGSTAYANYKTAGGNGMRVMAVPISNCKDMKTGNDPYLPQVGTACVFLTQPPYTAPKGEKVVPAQIIESCDAGGAINPANPILNGPYKIVLFKSPKSPKSLASGDS